MSSCDLFESRTYLIVGVKAFLVHKTVQSVASEDSFHFAEHGFNGIELGRVAHIVNALNVEPRPPLPQVFGLMNSQLVHEKSKWLVSVPVAELFQVLEETSSINGLRVNLAEAHAMLFSHACDH